MKAVLASLGLGALLCLPCLLVAGGVGAAAFGGALLAFAGSWAAGVVGVLLLLAAVLSGFWYARQRRTCPTCGVRGSAHGSHARDHRTPVS